MRIVHIRGSARAGHLSTWMNKACPHVKSRKTELWSYSHCTRKADEGFENKTNRPKPKRRKEESC